MRITSAQFHCPLRTDILRLQTKLGKEPLFWVSGHSWLTTCEAIRCEIEKYDQLMGYLYQCPLCLGPCLTSRDCHIHLSTCSYQKQIGNSSGHRTSDEDDVSFIGVFNRDSGQTGADTGIQSKELSRARNLRHHKHLRYSNYLPAGNRTRSSRRPQKARYDLRNSFLGRKAGRLKKCPDLERREHASFHRTAYKVEQKPHLTPAQIREVALSPSIHPLSDTELKQFFVQVSHYFFGAFKSAFY